MKCLVVRVEGELLLEAVVLLGEVEAVLLPRTALGLGLGLGLGGGVVRAKPFFSHALR